MKSNKRVSAVSETSISQRDAARQAFRDIQRERRASKWERGVVWVAVERKPRGRK